MKDFMEELLAEAEEDERKLHLAHIDLMLSELRKLEKSITANFSQVDEEKALLDEWAILKNVRLQEKADRITSLLKLFMDGQDSKVKTIDLKNGKLTRRKGSDKIIIVDMEKFLKNANKNMVTVQAEIIKPNLTKIKAFYKMTQKVPIGTELIEGEEKFNIKLNEVKDGKEEVRAGAEQANEYRDVV